MIDIITARMNGKIVVTNNFEMVNEREFSDREWHSTLILQECLSDSI